MKTTAMGLFLVIILATAPGDAGRDGPGPVQDVEVSGIIVDGLGRPIPGVTVAFSYHTGPYYALKKVPLTTFTTDDSGRYAGVVHNWPESTEVQRWVDKRGYVGSATHVSVSDNSELRRARDSRKTMWRQIPFEEAAENLSTLQGDALDQYVLEVLASQLWKLGPLYGNAPSIEDIFFARQDHLLAALHKACANPHVGDSVRIFLAFIGKLDDPHAQQLMRDEHPGTPKVEVSAPRLNDAVEKAAEAYQLIGQPEDVEIIIDGTVLTGSCDMALIRCHTHHGGTACQGFKLRFERVDGKWVLRAFVFEWLS